MLLAACEQFLGKKEGEIRHIALVTLEGHQRAIMGSMTVEEIYKDRKKFSKQVFEVASSDLVNMGITVVSYTLKDIRDEEVRTERHGIDRFFIKIKADVKMCNYLLASQNIYVHILVCSVLEVGKYSFLRHSAISVLLQYIHMYASSFNYL